MYSKKYLYITGFIILIFILLAIKVFSIYSDNNETEPNYNKTELYVEIKGEVINPGVYKININDRVMNIVELAGGFTDNADTTRVNLAQKLEDEMVIVIHSISEDINESKKVSINTGTLEELMTLDGIGKAKAQAIINYRTKISFFKTIEEIMNVSGIGEKTFENISDQITL